MTLPTCCYWLDKNDPEALGIVLSHSRQCGRKVSFKIVKDDRRKVRQYNPFLFSPSGGDRYVG